MCYMPFSEVGDSRMASITSSANVTAQKMKFWTKDFSVTVNSRGFGIIY